MYVEILQIRYLSKGIILYYNMMVLCQTKLSFNLFCDDTSHSGVYLQYYLFFRADMAQETISLLKLSDLISTYMYIIESLFLNIHFVEKHVQLSCTSGLHCPSSRLRFPSTWIKGSRIFCLRASPHPFLSAFSTFFRTSLWVGSSLST